jgi:hypothetical protein
VASANEILGHWALAMPKKKFWNPNTLSRKFDLDMIFSKKILTPSTLYRSSWLRFGNVTEAKCAQNGSRKGKRLL